jgi:DNA-directed RNA polymerase subunit K/omega
MVKYKEELQKIEQEIEKIALDTKLDKYKIVPHIARWAAELKYKEETKDLLDSERINKALYDVLTGKVTIEEIKNLPPLSVRKKLNLVETQDASKADNILQKIIEPKKNKKEKK